jgi:hypothetical protein
MVPTSAEANPALVAAFVAMLSLKMRASGGEETPWPPDTV